MTNVCRPSVSASSMTTVFALSLLLLAVGTLATGKSAHVIHPSLGPMSTFDMNALKPMAYLMNSSLVMLEGFQILTEATSVLAFDAPNQVGFANILGTIQWFIANGTYTYISAEDICLLQVANGTFQDLVDQYGGLLYSTTLEVAAVDRHANKHGARNDEDHRPSPSSSAHPSPSRSAHPSPSSSPLPLVGSKKLHQYVGLITLTELPNSVVMTVDEDGLIYSTVTTGPQDEDQLLGGIYSVSSSLLEYAPIGSNSWATIPSLPVACLGDNVIPYMTCLLTPAGCRTL